MSSATNLLRTGSHSVSFAFQSTIVIDQGALGLNRWPNAPLALLHDVPSLVRQVPLLAWSEVDFISLGIRKRIDARRLRGVGMYLHI